MRRIVIALALSLFLIGCESSRDAVALRIYEGSSEGCSVAGGYRLDLIADSTFGTKAGHIEAWGMLPPMKAGPVWWPKGYTGRRDGAEVVVYNAEGTEVARTGARYVLGVPFEIAAEGERLVACFIRACSEPCPSNEPSSRDAEPPRP